MHYIRLSWTDEDGRHIGEPIKVENFNWHVDVWLEQLLINSAQAISMPYGVTIVLCR